MLQLIYYIALSPTPTTLTRDAQSINIHIHLTATDHPNFAHILATVFLNTVQEHQLCTPEGRITCPAKDNSTPFTVTGGSMISC
jgi:hypothetical protein